MTLKSNIWQSEKLCIFNIMKTLENSYKNVQLNLHVIF